MTKKQLAELQDIQFRITKGIDFLKRDSIFICSDKLPNSTSYYNKEGKGITEVNKNIGSDLCYFYSALSNLNALIIREQNIPTTS